MCYVERNILKPSIIIIEFKEHKYIDAKPENLKQEGIYFTYTTIVTYFYSI